MESEMEVDVVVYGTGITASLIAASLTGNGFRVLQVDFRSSYGGDYRTFTFKQLITEKEAVRFPEGSHSCKETEHLVCHENDGDHGSVGTPKEYQTMCKGTRFGRKIFYQVSPFSDNVESTYQSLVNDSSRYAIDLWPKFIYSKSAAVELFLRSSSDHYLRFCSNSGPILIGNEGEHDLNEVCNSKGSIFRSTYLEPMEKRILMKFINELSDLVNTKVFSSDSLQRADFEADSQGSRFSSHVEDNESWVEFLRNKNFNDKMIKLISYGICLGGNEYRKWSKADGLKRLLKYVESIGVFGDFGGCLLYTLYGTSDIVHAICRLSAVHGCTFMLNTRIEHVHMSDGKVSGLTLSNSIFVKTKLLISEYSDVSSSESWQVSELGNLHVISLVTKDFLFEGPNVAVLIPKEEEDEPIYVVQTDWESGTAPKDSYIIHLLTVDKAPPSHFTSFSNTTGVASRLINAYKSLAPDLESTTLALYTTHELGNFSDALTSIDMHRGFLKNYKSNGLIKLPLPSGRPTVLLMESVSIARYVCGQLLDRETNSLDLYDRMDLKGFIDFERPKEDAEITPFDKLDEIITKFSNQRL